ncbi:MAG: CvpA family protein [Parvularculaceae bacterium]
MTVFDALLLAILGVSIAFAAARGAIREMTTLAALGIAGLAAWAGAAPLLGLFRASGFFETVAASAAIGFAVFAALYVLAHKGFQRLKLSPKQRQADRIGGGAFGLVRALALIGLGFLGYGYYLDEPNQPDAVRKALLLPVAAASASFFERYAPSYRALPATAAAPAAQPANAAREGYASADRSGLKEIVATVTTSDANNPSTADSIADIINEDGNPDVDRQRR